MKKTFYCQQNVNNNRKKYFYNQKENNKTCQQNKINALGKKTKQKQKAKTLKNCDCKSILNFQIAMENVANNWPQHLEKKMKKNNENYPLIILKKLLKSKTDLMAHHIFDQKMFNYMFIFV